MSARGFSGDTRGNTTIPALFAGGFLIGGVWYLVGLGDAMVFHEAMQDAADATSFAPSVLNARGMNVLAMVNLVMSAILAVLVAVKIVQLLLLAATVIACAMPLNPYCPLLSSWQSPYANFVKLTDRTVSTVNKSLYNAESALAKTIPVIGQAKAATAARGHGPMIEGGFVASAALVPGGGGGGGGRWGLPVEDEEYKNLCLHASEDVKGILFKPLKFLPGANAIVAPINKLVSALVDQLVKSFPGYFCGGGAGGFGSLGGVFKDLAKDVAKQGIAKVAETACKQAGDSVSRAACTSGLTSSIGSISSGSSITGNQQTSKRIYRPAVMGSDYYASYGFVFSKHLEATDPDPGLAAASWDRVPAKVLGSALDRMFAQLQFSKTELYYDPRREGPKGGQALSDESLLNMRWRARIRRYRPPTSDVRQLISGQGAASILSSIRSAPAGMNPGAILGIVLGRDPEDLARWAELRGVSGGNRGAGGILH